MKITVISGIAVFTSAIAMADLETLKKVTPEVLIAKNEDKEIEIPLDAFNSKLYEKAPECDVFGEKLTARVQEKSLFLNVPKGKSFLIKL